MINAYASIRRCLMYDIIIEIKEKACVHVHHLEIRGMTKYRKERSFRERKIFIRKEHFITLLSALNSFRCHFKHLAIKI